MFSNKTIVIVNGSKTLSRQFNNILSETNSIILEASNIIELCDLIKKNNGLVDLVIFDISIEYDEGLNFIRQFKEIKEYKKIPIIIVSVYSSRDFVIAAKELDIADFIKKPFGKEIVLNKLSRIFNS